MTTEEIRRELMARHEADQRGQRPTLVGTQHAQVERPQGPCHVVTFVYEDQTARSYDGKGWF